MEKKGGGKGGHRFVMPAKRKLSAKCRSSDKKVKIDNNKSVGEDELERKDGYLQTPHEIKRQLSQIE